MAKVGAQRAAELTGSSKSTIQRAMKSGKISFEMDKNGRRVIDVAELERAFGLVKQENTPVSENTEDAMRKDIEIERMQMKITMLEEQLSNAQLQIDDLKSQRDEWQKQAQQVLLTSQYSQKQAEDYRSQLEMQKKREMMRRKAIKEAQAATNENVEESSEGEGKASIQDIWKKLRGAA